MMKRLFERILNESCRCACCGEPTDGQTVAGLLGAEDDPYWSHRGFEEFLDHAGLNEDDPICYKCYESEMISLQNI